MNATTHMSGYDWRQAAACADVDPEIFYPLDLYPIGPAVTSARAICAGCPVRTACLRDVMAGEDSARRWGITGGHTPDERTALYAAQRLGSVGSGSVAA